ncbi:MAG: ABC transporter substrate-binding protein [Mariprofundaceae bacterium]|nr:ABC transporter substrate-binding protein [Mariprofundaceae bacterium]
MIYLLFLCLFLVSCQPVELPKHELRIGLAQDVMSVDPRYATDASSHKVQALLHCSLVRLDERFLAQPGLATSWQQEDAYTWHFELDENARFHDGSQVSAQDVAATLKAILDKKKASPLRAGFASIEKIEVHSKHQLTLHLNKEDPSLLTRLSIGVLPVSWAEKEHQSRQTMGCGDFKLASWHYDKGLLLVRRDGRLRLRFLNVKDPVTRILKLVQGEIDFTQNDLPVHLLSFLKKYPDIKVQHRASTNFSYIGMNLEDPILKQREVRQALALAVDRKKLKKVLFGDYPSLATTILSPQHWTSMPLAQIPFDFKKAEFLLDEAGFKRDAQGIRFHLSYRTSTNPVRLRMASAVAAMWQRIGVDVSVESMEWGGFYARIKRGDFQVFSLAWVGINDPDIYKWVLHSDMHPPKGANRGRYSNPEVDALLDGLTQANMLENYRQIQKIMHRDVVYIPLWYDAVISLSNSRVQGFEPTWDASFEPFKTVQVKDF